MSATSPPSRKRFPSISSPASSSSSRRRIPSRAATSSSPSSRLSQGKFTTECINFLVEHGHADELAAALKRWQTEQNLRAPVLLWIVKNRHSKKFAKLLNDLITPRLLSAIFFAIDYEALQASNARRIPLADILSEDTDLISDLLSTADPETARDLANTLMLNQGFEELTKKSLLARFIKIFPKIQSLVAADAESKEEQLLVSKRELRAQARGIRDHRLQEDPGELQGHRHRPRARRPQGELRIQDGEAGPAGPHGAETLLERDLGRARITDFKEATTEQVSVGSIVEVKNTTSGQTTRYTLLGAWDGEPDKNILSYKTPFGAALLGKKTKDVVTVKTGASEEDYQIISIARYADTV
jgi:transcription elongation GreA/GreB family factor